MDPQFWLDRWQNQEIGFHLDGVNPLLERHWSALDAPAGCAVFVPLCGKSLDLVYLRRLGHPVVGVELSALAVGQFFAENGLEPRVAERGPLRVFEAGGITLYQGDLFALTPADLPAIGAVYDRASLIALPPERQPAYAEHLLALVPEAAPILLIALDYPAGEMQGPPFSTPAAQVERLYGPRRAIDALEVLDALADSPALRARGLTALGETAWRLRAPG